MSEGLRPFSPSSRWEPSLTRGSALFDSVADAAALFEGFARFPSVEELDQRLSPLAGVRFELQAPKKKRRRRRAEPVDVRSLYDGRINVDGVVPTRAESYHDLFNALVWASFPQAKRALHRRQYAAASARIGGPTTRLPGTRTREEDSLTMLDEGGELWLVDSDADAALVEAGGEPPRLRRLVFGHALLEHAQAGLEGARPRRLPLVLPSPALSVSLTELPLAELRRAADEALAAYLARGGC